MRLDRGPPDGGPHCHLGIARHLPRAPALIDERPQTAVGEPFEGALRGLPAGVDAEERRRRYLADDLPVSVLDASQNAAVRLGDELDRLGGEAVNGPGVRGAVGDPPGVGVGEGAELVEAGPRPDVVRLGDC